MQEESRPNDVLVIDKLEHWRTLSLATLRVAGFTVCAAENYECELVSKIKNGSFDLVILGCARIGSEELDLIKQIHHNKVHLLVLCTCLRLRIMRLLFRLGVDDVAEKPFDSMQLLDVVDHAIKSISMRTGQRDYV